MTRKCCPACGFNLAADEPIEIGRWKVLPGQAFFDGVEHRLTVAEHRLLHAVAREHPRLARRSAVVNRISTSAEADNVVSVLVTRLRKKLGANCPIETVRGFGFRWIEPVPMEAA